MQSLEIYKKIAYWICSVSCVFGFSVQAQTIYIIQKGDLLSNILIRHQLRPIYGASGFLKKTIHLNPALLRNGGNIIYPGQKVFLPIQIHQQLEPGLTTSSEIDPPKKSVENSLASTEKNISSVTDYPVSSIHLGFIVDYFRYDTQDRLTQGEAQVLSDPNWGIDMAWVIHWDLISEFFFKAAYQRYSIQNPNINIVYNNQQGGLTQFGLGYGHLLLDRRFLVRMGLDMKQALFIHSPALNTIQFDSLIITQPYLSGRYTFLRSGRFSLGLDAEYRYLMETSNDIYEVQSGAGYLGGIFVREVFRDKRFSGLEARINYLQQRQDTNLETQNEKKVSFELGLDWEL